MLGKFPVKHLVLLAITCVMFICVTWNFTEAPVGKYSDEHIFLLSKYTLILFFFPCH